MRNPITRGWNVVNTSFRERPTDMFWIGLGPYGFRKLMYDVRRERYLHFQIGQLHAECLAAFFAVSVDAINEHVAESLGIAKRLSECWPQGVGNMGHLKGAIALYVITRLTNPHLVVETGVASGISTSFIEAMERNKNGAVISIDVKNADSRHIPQEAKTGWMIPPSHRRRWQLEVGDSRDVLTRILDRVGEIDLFLHDSLHTAEHQRWEYERGWSALRSGGFLLSDNVENGAFAAFCRQMGVQHIVAHSVWRGPRLGLCRKPGA